MSHITTVSVVIKDLEALRAAAESLGLEMVKADKYKWYGRVVGKDPGQIHGIPTADLGQCEYALRVKGADKSTYEIGVARRRDGVEGWTLLYDYWMGGFGLMEKIGNPNPDNRERAGQIDNADKLVQGYSTEVARRKLVGQGFRVATSRNDKNEVVLHAIRR